MQPRIENRWIAPRVDDLARWIQLDDERRHSAGVQVRLENVLPVENEDVILIVDADTAQASENPLVRQRLRPRAIDLVTRSAGLRADGRRRQAHEPNKQTAAGRTSEFHRATILRYVRVKTNRSVNK